MISASAFDLREKYREEAVALLTQYAKHDIDECDDDGVRQLSDEESSLWLTTARSMILRSMYDEHEGGSNSVRHDFYCLCCGNALLPLGPDSSIIPDIKLKKLKRSNTRRRRASRKKAKKIAFDKQVLQKHRGGGRSFAQQGSTDSHGSAVDSLMNTRETLKKRHALSSVRDGGGKNCISYKCSHCGYEKFFKGLPVKKKDARDDDFTRTLMQGKKSTKTSTSAKSTGNKSKSLVSNSETGFISLGTSPKPPTRKLKPLEQGGKKKRQKKTKKTALSDFLSSLND